jgi:small-conductance mechanosensitive channel
VAFWISQGISLTLAVLLVVGLISIWFNDPTRLTTAAGLVTAGLAFALQKLVTGRVVTVSNARIFDEPVYNYSRDFL